MTPLVYPLKPWNPGTPMLSRYNPEGYFHFLKPPLLEFVKMNFDGSICGAKGSADMLFGI